MPRALCTVALVSALFVSACGSGSEPTTATTAGSVPPLADGTVPWLDQPADDAEFSRRPRPRRMVPDGAEPCTAAQLVGTLPRWDRKGSATLGLFGVVEVRNRSTQGCTLRGEVPTRLLVDDRPAPVRESHNVNDEARNRVTALPPGEAATLRVDWSPPYCGPTGRQALEITLPGGGGVVRADVAEPAQPVCTASETGPELRSYVSASAFDEPPVPTPLDSAFNGVTIALVDTPTTGTAGGDLRYVVAIANPTDADIALDPCPGYGQEVFSTGDARYEAVNERAVYRLNCRTVAALPAKGTVRFEMRTKVPDRIEPGRRFTVTWALLAPALAPGPGHRAAFTVTIT